MIQALPLVESGAADTVGLTDEQLVLACASHRGAHIHTDRVQRWLSYLGKTDDNLRCGPEFPRDTECGNEMIRATNRRVATETGAEAVLIAILPGQKPGVTIRITDSTTRVSECAIASILVKPGALKRRNAPIPNRREIITGHIRP